MVFTHGFRASPRSTAFFASSPAPIITSNTAVVAVAIGKSNFVASALAATVSEDGAATMEGSSANAAYNDKQRKVSKTD